jgi:hypothetical protein
MGDVSSMGVTSLGSPRRASFSRFVPKAKSPSGGTPKCSVGILDHALNSARKRPDDHRINANRAPTKGNGFSIVTNSLASINKVLAERRKKAFLLNVGQPTYVRG